MIIKMPSKSGKEMDRIIGTHMFHIKTKPLDDLYKRISNTSEPLEYDDVVEQLEFPRYSKEIEIAWDIVDCLIRETESVQYDFKLSRRFDCENRVWGFEAEFYTPDVSFSAWGFSAPIAICKAAIEIIIDNAGNNYSKQNPTHEPSSQV